MSIASEALRMTGLFEAELLVELMLRHWRHPLADDGDFRSNLLESAADALRAAAKGQKLIEDLRGRDTNLVAAIWYAEWVTLTSSPAEDQTIAEARSQWLEVVRRALPSCFCDPDLLA